MNHPDKYKVMLLLRVSDHIDEQVKCLAEEGYEELTALVLECLGSGALKGQPSIRVSPFLILPKSMVPSPMKIWWVKASRPSGGKW
jgi:hypothetical protein